MTNAYQCPTDRSLARRATGADNAEKRVETLTAELASAKSAPTRSARAARKPKRSSTPRAGEIRELGASLKAYKGSATKARNEATILKRELSPESRPIGAMKLGKAPGDEAARAEAIEAAFTSGPTEIVFSDGKREIRELAPLIVDASAWQETPRGRVLNHEPLLEPGFINKPELRLAGFGLLNEAGVQVAYHALPDVITILSGQRMQIPKGCIRF
jgi:hypothetical protein